MGTFRYGMKGLNPMPRRWRRRPLLQQMLKAGYPSHLEGFRKTDAGQERGPLAGEAF